MYSVKTPALCERTAESHKYLCTFSGSSIHVNGPLPNLELDDFLLLQTVQVGAFHVESTKDHIATLIQFVLTVFFFLLLFTGTFASLISSSIVIQTAVDSICLAAARSCALRPWQLKSQERCLTTTGKHKAASTVYLPPASFLYSFPRSEQTGWMRNEMPADERVLPQPRELLLCSRNETDLEGLCAEPCLEDGMEDPPGMFAARSLASSCCPSQFSGSPPWQAVEKLWDEAPETPSFRLFNRSSLASLVKALRIALILFSLSTTEIIWF